MQTEDRALEIGRRLLAEGRERKSGFWARERWEESMLRKLMDSGPFRVQALRFVDVLPALRTDEEVLRHLREYFGDEELPLPGLARWGLDVTRGGLGAGLAAGAVRTGIQTMAGKFIGGADVREATRAVEGLRKEGMAFTLDLLGEAAVSEAESAQYLDRYMHLLEAFPPRVARWKPNPLLDTVNGRTAPRFNLSVKVSSLYSQFNPVDPAGSAEAVKARLRPVLQRARSQGAFVCLDMEQYDFKHIVLRVFRELLQEPEFRNWPDGGLAMQAYLRETEADIRELIRWCRERGAPITVRLVRGAYWDYETVIARQNDWPVPVWTRKVDTDRCYERCLRLLLENHPVIETAIATHNVRSLALGMAVAEERGLNPDQFEIQMLYGMADPLKDAVSRMGRRLRVYVPFGELIPGMAYLVRRLLENTASQSFLRMGFAEDAAPEVLLAAPPDSPPNPGLPAPRPTITPASSSDRGAELRFENEPVRRFTDAGERTRFAEAISRVRGEMGQDYPAVLHGRDQVTGKWITSLNPAAPAEVVGRVAEVTQADAEAAIRSARAALPAWSRRTPQQRAEVLFRAAAVLRSTRDEHAAWQVLECGKPWREADADVCEAIDFLEYYGREGLRLGTGLPLHAPGERNDYSYVPRGVCVVLPPWNFPLAIMAGMTTAALVTGNAVLLKPSELSSVIAARFVRVLRESGLPDGVLNFLPGRGADVGEYLVRHPGVDLIAFTGSRRVGTRIYELAAQTPPGQDHLKRVVAEMGGKNAIIVDSDADLDDAVVGTSVSAFGFAGQKCSAASRVIIVGSAYEEFLGRLAEATRSIRVGSPEDPGVLTGPVISDLARDRIRAAVEAGRAAGKVLVERDVADLGDGYFVGPTVFTDVSPDSPLAREEIFGPVIAAFRAKEIGEALALANGTEYALTGGVYSRSPENLQRAREEFRVGNLYLNRKITGAIVNRQPFGGFKMSGVGSKAGGPDYLLQFVEPRVVTENTIRRGFAPETDTLAAELGGP